MTVWFITGASRGLGLELARAALERGDRVVAAVRDPAAMPALPGELHAVRLDVTDPARAESAVREAVDRFGRIDVLVNNAGYGLFGAVEEVSDAEVRSLFDTNVFGLLNVTRAALPVLRAQRSGRVINIGSVVGIATGCARGVYGASKFAVEALTEAMREELAPLGIAVTVVEPGSFRTEFLAPASVRRSGARIADYEPTSGALIETIAARNGAQPGDPAKAAAALLRLADAPEPPTRLALGPDSVRVVEDKTELLAKELQEWRTLSVSTSY